MYRNTTRETVAMRRSATSEEAESLGPGEVGPLTGVDMDLPQNAAYLAMGVLEKVDGRQAPARAARSARTEGE
jgi:hypothetical protein